MNEQFIELTDGTRLAAKINFGTLYYLNRIGGDKLAKKLDLKEKKKLHISDSERMEFAAKVIYAILRSNGRQVTFDEALMLVPIDEDSIQALINAYSDELEKIKKKQESKVKMKSFAQR